jgi:hypothetical protein
MTLSDFACNGGGSATTMTQSSSENNVAFNNVAVNKGTGDVGTIEVEVFLLGGQETRTIRRKKDRRREKLKKKITQRT